MIRILATAVLGQLDWQAAPPPPLGRPAFIPYAVLENPVPLAVLLLAAALIGGFVLNRRGRFRGAATLAAACVVAAAIVAAAGAMVTTRREAALVATVELVDAVARIDEPGMRRLLAEDARLVVSGRVPGLSTGAPGLDRDRTIEEVRSQLTRHRILEHQTRALAAELTGPNTAVSQCRVRVVVEGEGFATNSWWRLHWRSDPDGSWRAIEISPWSIDGVGTIGR